MHQHQADRWPGRRHSLATLAFHFSVPVEASGRDVAGRTTRPPRCRRRRRATGQRQFRHHRQTGAGLQVERRRTALDRGSMNTDKSATAGPGARRASLRRHFGASPTTAVTVALGANSTSSRRFGRKPRRTCPAAEPALDRGTAGQQRERRNGRGQQRDARTGAHAGLRGHPEPAFAWAGAPPTSEVELEYPTHR